MQLTVRCVFATCCFLYFFATYGNEERADLTTEQPDELHFHGVSRLLVTSHCLFSFSVYLVKNCNNKKTTTTTTKLTNTKRPKMLQRLKS